MARPFLKGAATGAIAMYVLVWVFPAIAPVAHDAFGGDGDLPALEQLRRRGVARVGFANEAPYAYLDPATGRLTGEAPEVARAVLAELGVERVEGVLTEFGALIPGLQAGRFDLIAAGMYITPARCREVAFSNPTYAIGEALIVRAGNPERLHAYEDLARHPRATLAVVTGAIQRGYALAAGVPEARIAVFGDAPSALAAVASGRADAYAGTSLTVADLLAKAGDARLARAEPFRDPIVDGAPARGHGAFVFRKRDTGLRRAFDLVLADYLGTPAHAAAVAPFGFAREHLPGAATAARLCEARD